MTNEVISRAEAKARGLPAYFTGKPCVRGHIDERRTHNGECAECCRIYARGRRAVNPDAARAADRKSYKKNSERRKQNMLERYHTNKVERNEKRRIHRQKNKEAYAIRDKAAKLSRMPEVLASVAKRRASKLQAAPAWDSELDQFAASEAADLCRRREAATGLAWHVDHMIPLQARKACGLHVAKNLQVIPASLNLAKNNRMHLTEPGEWLKHV